MNNRRTRFAPSLAGGIESLESRIVLSGVDLASTLPHRAVEVAAETARNPATATRLAVSAGTLGQPISFTVTVAQPPGRARRKERWTSSTTAT